MKEMLDLQEQITADAAKSEFLEQAAQKYMSLLYDRLNDSIIMARLFAAIQFKILPESNKCFVTKLAEKENVSDKISDQTLVLSLLGSRGVNPEWNDRRNSKDHIGIPLISKKFISKAPMISQLLDQFGIGMDWIDSTDKFYITKTLNSLSGIFFIKNAETEVNEHGDKIIVAQDFVKREGIKSVFGIGGCYLGTSVFFASIIFTNEEVDENIVKRFVLQAIRFKTATMQMVKNRKIFIE